VIVGGGAIGAACARQLAGADRRVRVIDSNTQSGEAWRASAGMLAPQIETPVDDPLFELGIAGREFYRENSAPLRDATGVDIGLRESGILQAATTPHEVESLKARVAWQRQHGHHCEWLGPDEVRRDWSFLAATSGALLAPRDGYLDPVKLVEALLADAKRLGAEVIQDKVISLTHSNGKVTGIQGREWHPAGQVVLAAGAWSGRIANLPRPISVEPVRGQLIAYPWPSGMPPATVFGHHSYLLPRGSEAVAGSTMEHAGFAAEVTEAGIVTIRERVESLVPALRDARILRAWAGLRPWTPDGRPIVGREPDLDGLWYATGHGRNGILYAGVTARIIADLMAGEPTFEEAEVIRPERFWSW
jgi:glycine oxidase